MPGKAGQAHFTSTQPLDTAWHEHALCREHPDIDWFDTECGLQAAASICYLCPVKNDCLDYAVQIRAEDGVWAGLWGQQLQAMIAHRVRSRA